MPLTYQAITANCANKGMGMVACNKIAEQLRDKQPDFVVINCQEANYAAAIKELETALGKDSGYTVTLVGKMPTYTKLESVKDDAGVGLDKTGIGTYVIHKKHLNVQASEPELARRSSVFNPKNPTPFNKGGMVTNLIVTDLTNLQNKVHVQTVSVHFDSKDKCKKKVSERMTDLYNTKRAMAKDQVTWKDLVEAPNLVVSGGDLNIRNKYNDGKTGESIWKSKDTQEMQGFKQAALGGLSFSQDSTYKTDNATINQDEDPKRPGYTRGGAMDLISIQADDTTISSEMYSTEGVTAIDPEDSKNGRDHAVIISPMLTYNNQNIPEFDRVKNQIAAQLSACAPKLASEIRLLEETSDNQTKLVDTYNKYLSKDGLLNQEIKAHAKSWACFKKASKIDSELGTQIEKSLMVKAWLEVDPDFKKFKSEALKALKACKTPEDLSVVKDAIINERLNTPEVNKIKDRGIRTDIINGFNSVINKLTALLGSDKPCVVAESVSQELSEFNETMSSTLEDLRADNQTLIIPIVVSAMNVAEKAETQLKGVLSLPEGEEKISGRIVAIVKDFISRITNNMAKLTSGNDLTSTSSMKSRFQNLMASSKAIAEPRPEDTLSARNEQSGPGGP